VTVPLRGVAFGFAPMLRAVDPLPFPDPPLVTVIHPALLVADHGQPVNVVTPTLLVVAPAPTDWFVGLIENVQGAPVCVTV
jgi:hypothetical protein